MDVKVIVLLQLFNKSKLNGTKPFLEPKIFSIYSQNLNFYT